MLSYFGWIIAVFLIGLLLLLWYRITYPTLKAHFLTINHFRGKSYDEIPKLLSAVPQQTEDRENGQRVRIWCTRGYSISLLFDRHEFCLGVEQECN